MALKGSWRGIRLKVSYSRLQQVGRDELYWFSFFGGLRDSHISIFWLLLFTDQTRETTIQVY